MKEQIKCSKTIAYYHVIDSLLGFLHDLLTPLEALLVLQRLVRLVQGWKCTIEVSWGDCGWIRFLCWTTEVYLCKHYIHPWAFLYHQWKSFCLLELWKLDGENFSILKSWHLVSTTIYGSKGMASFMFMLLISIWGSAWAKFLELITFLFE